MNDKKERQRALYQNRKNQGLCGLCGNPREDLTKSICSGCKEKQQSKYKKRRASGKCFICDQTPLEEGASYCKYHYDLRMDRRQKRREAGECYQCGGEAIALGKRCRSCWFKNIARMLDGPTADELEAKFDRQKQTCPLSGRKLVLGENTHLDHIVARARGGTDEMNNLRWVDQQVNQAKGAMSDKEFLSLVKEICQKKNL